MQKKILSVLLAIVMIMSVMPMVTLVANADSVTVSTDWYTKAAEGVGTSEDNPYLLHNTADLEGLASLVNASNKEDVKFERKFIKLADDFDGSVPLTTGIGFGDPFSGLVNFFKGTFDGNNKTVTLKIKNDSLERLGLFGACKNATLKNVIVTGTIESTSAKFAGGLIAECNNTTVTDCTSYVNISNTHTDKIQANSGGLIGCAKNKSAINHSSYSGEIISNTVNTAYVGGLCAQMNTYVTISNCNANVKIKADATGTDSSVYAGGLVAMSASCNITNSYAIGTIEANAGFVLHLGGAAGNFTNSNSSITNVYAACTLNGTGTKKYVGGLIGSLGTGPICSYCYYLKGTANFGIGANGTTLCTEDPATVLNLTKEEMKTPSGEPGNRIDTLNAYATSDEGKKAGCMKWFIDANVNDGYPYLLDWDTDWYDNAEEGVGESEDNPYVLNSTADLEGLAILVNATEGAPTFENKFIKLADDFNGSVALTTPIGAYNTTPFKGSFDGNNQTVKLNMKNNNSLDYLGLFGYCLSAKIKNVNINGDIESTSATYVGGLAASISLSTVSDCASYVNISTSNSNTTSSTLYYGGLLGQIFSCTVKNSSYCGKISCNGQVHVVVGGVCGGEARYSKIYNCNADVEIAASTAGAEKRMTAGGLVGLINNSDITNSYVTGIIAAKSNNELCLGGLVGQALSTSHINNVYATCTLNSKGTTEFVGGVVGSASLNASLSFCYYLQDTATYGVGGNTTTLSTTENANTTPLTADKMKAASGVDGCLVDKLNEYATSDAGKKAGCMRWRVLDNVNNGYPSLFNCSTAWYDNAEEGVGESEANPYVLNNTADLEGLASLVNATEGALTFENKFIKLADDFDGSVALTTPIGTTKTSFKGSFDGNNQTVKLNMKNNNLKGIGLFGFCNNAFLKNIIVTGTIESTSTTYVGGLAASITMSSTISNCASYVNISISNTDENDIHFYGGLLGQASKITVKNSSYCGKISCNDQASLRVGGLCAQAGVTSNIFNCNADVEIEARTAGEDKEVHTGGLVGNLNSSNITNSYATGTVSANGATVKLGGLAGNQGNTSCITNVYATCTLKATGTTKCVGGVFGCAVTRATLSSCYYLQGTADFGVGSLGSATCTAENANTTPLTADKMKAASGVDGCLVDKLNAYATSDKGKEAGCMRWTINTANNGYPYLYNCSTAWYDNAEEGVGESEDNPYVLNSTADLEGLAILVNGGTNSFASKFIKLADDFDGSVALTTPIGTSNTTFFKGTFDGNNQTVKLNMKNNSLKYIGLFGYCASVTINNVIVTGTIESTSATYVGGLAAYISFSTVSDCASYVNITSKVENSISVGGLLGDVFFNTNVKNSSYCGKIDRTCTGSDITTNIGGICGIVRSRCGIANCYADADINANAPGKDTLVYAGGLVGYNQATIKNCYATGTVTANSTDILMIGGAVGYNDGVTENIYAACTLSSSNHSAFGGVIGKHSPTSSNKYSSLYYLDGTADFGIGAINNNTCTAEPDGVKALTETEMQHIPGSDENLVDKLNAYATSAEGKAVGLKPWKVTYQAYPTFTDYSVQVSFSAEDVREYANVNDALKAIGEGTEAEHAKATVKLIGDTAEHFTITKYQEITLDLNGYTFSDIHLSNGPIIYVFGTLTIVDNSTQKTGRILTTGQGISNEGTLNIQDIKLITKAGTIGFCIANYGICNISGNNTLLSSTTNNVADTNSIAILNIGSLTVTGGKIIAEGGTTYALQHCKGDLSISDGVEIIAKGIDAANSIALYSAVNCTLSAGKFNGALGIAKNKTLTITGGSYTTNPSDYVDSNNYKVVDNGENAAYRYTVSEKTATSISAPSTVTKKYDGSALSGAATPSVTTNTTVTYETKTTADGQYATYTGTPSLTDAGTLYVRATAKHADYKTVSVEYVLTVNKRSVTLTSGTTERMDNDNALQNTNVTVDGDGFITGEGAQYSDFATQSGVGSKQNTFSYSLTGNAKAGNYDITKSYGTLTITAKPTTTISEPATLKKTYDGSALSGAATPAVTDGTSVTYETKTTKDGQYTTYTGTPSLTDVGVLYVKATAKNAGYQDAVAEYKLEVTKRKVTLTSGSTERMDDGNALQNTNVTVGGEGFATGEGATYSNFASQSGVGSKDNTFKVNLKSNTKAGNYVITKAYGKLTITVNYVRDYNIEKKKLTDALKALNVDHTSLHSTRIINKAIEEINAREYDSSKSYEENCKITAQIAQKTTDSVLKRYEAIYGNRFIAFFARILEPLFDLFSKLIKKL